MAASGPPRHQTLIVLVIGLLLFATAAASAIILIVQNRGSVVQVRALGHSWTGHLYWLLVAGLIIALVGVLGLALLRGSAARARRLRRQRATLLVGNARLSERVRDHGRSSFFADAGRADTGPAQSPAGSHATVRRHFFRRGHHAV